LQIGTVFKQGEQITTLGDASVNGDYAPIYISNYKNIADKFGDYPGVCKKIIFYLGTVQIPTYY
jgi:hypothetical protein